MGLPDALEVDPCASATGPVGTVCRRLMLLLCSRTFQTDFDVRSFLPSFVFRWDNKVLGVEIIPAKRRPRSRCMIVDTSFRLCAFRIFHIHRMARGFESSICTFRTGTNSLA